MILNFEDDLGPRHFDFCFSGFILGGCLQQTKGLTVLRRELGILEKLESISAPKPCGKKIASGEPDRILLNGDTKLELKLDVTEYDLLYNYIAQVPWQSGTPVKNALEALQWLENCQRNQ